MKIILELELLNVSYIFSPSVMAENDKDWVRCHDARAF